MAGVRGMGGVPYALIYHVVYRDLKLDNILLDQVKKMAGVRGMEGGGCTSWIDTNGSTVASSRTTYYWTR
jgi:hypothetical protein